MHNDWTILLCRSQMLDRRQDAYDRGGDAWAGLGRDIGQPLSQ